jgi:hypothetical protein
MNLEGREHESAAGTRPMVLETLVRPDELLRIDGRGPRMKASLSNSARHAGAVPSSTIFFPRGGAPRERNQPCGQGGSGRSRGLMDGPSPLRSWRDLRFETDVPCLV